jgi:hypothetical protein
MLEYEMGIDVSLQIIPDALQCWYRAYSELTLFAIIQPMLAHYLKFDGKASLQ